MSQLKPCPSCQRHIKLSESACPFCAQPVPAGFARPRRRALPETRLGRAATFAFGLGALGQVAGCDDDTDESKTDAEAVQDAAMTDAGAPQDAGSHDPGSDGSMPDAEAEDPDWDSGGIPIYAAAPTDDDGTRWADRSPNSSRRKS